MDTQGDTAMAWLDYTRHSYQERVEQERRIAAVAETLARPFVKLEAAIIGLCDAVTPENITGRPRDLC